MAARRRPSPPSVRSTCASAGRGGERVHDARAARAQAGALRAGQPRPRRASRRPPTRTSRRRSAATPTSSCTARWRRRSASTTTARPGGARGGRAPTPRSPSARGRSSSAARDDLCLAWLLRRPARRARPEAPFVAEVTGLIGAGAVRALRRRVRGLPPVAAPRGGDRFDPNELATALVGRGQRAAASASGDRCRGRSSPTSRRARGRVTLDLPGGLVDATTARAARDGDARRRPRPGGRPPAAAAARR